MLNQKPQHYKCEFEVLKLLTIQKQECVHVHEGLALLRESLRRDRPSDYSLATLVSTYPLHQTVLEVQQLHHPRGTAQHPETITQSLLRAQQ